MKIKCTDAKIKSLKPGPKSIEYFDNSRNHGAGALGLRISPKNKRVWFVMYHAAGRVRRYTLGVYPAMSLKVARKEANAIMARVDKGDDPMQEKKDYNRAETFSDLWEFYLTAPGIGRSRIKRFTDKAPSTQAEDRRKYQKHLQPYLGGMKLVDIRPKDIKRVLGKLDGKKHSGNRLYALLSVLFKHAVNEEMITHSPMPVFGEKEEARDRVLSDSEIQTIWPELSGPVGAAYKIILLTGQRPGQVCGMKSAEIEGNEWILSRGRTKSKKATHVVPLSPMVLELIESQANDSEYVFRIKKSHLKSTQYYRHQVQERTNTTGWTAHDLRRTCRTLLGKLQVKPHVAELVIGHAQTGIVAVYDRYSYLPEKKRALNKLADYIEGLTGHHEKAKIINIR